MSLGRDCRLSEGVVAAELEGLVDLGVGEGFVLALVPAEAAEDAQGVGELLLGVEAEAVLDGAEGLVLRDVGGWIDVGEEGIVRVAVEAHVGVVDVAEEADGAFAVRREETAEDAVAQFEFHVLAAGAAQVPVEVDAVGDGGHQGEAVAGGPGFVVVLGDGGVGVAAGVGGVVPCAVVVGGPVQELQVAVGADAVEVEDVGQAHLADAEFEAAFGDLSGERERRRARLR